MNIAVGVFISNSICVFTPKPVRSNISFEAEIMCLALNMSGLSKIDVREYAALGA